MKSNEIQKERICTIIYAIGQDNGEIHLSIKIDQWCGFDITLTVEEAARALADAGVSAASDLVGKKCLCGTHGTWTAGDKDYFIRITGDRV